MSQSFSQANKANERRAVQSPPSTGKEQQNPAIEDKTVLLTGGVNKPDEMQIVWSKTEVVRAISGKNKVSPPPSMYSFKVIEGQDKGKVHPLKDKTQFCIGRGGADITIRDTRVSKIHCMIEIYDGIVVIKDMNSTNGSLLNQFVLAEDFLKHGDRIQIGHTVMEFQVRN